MCVKALASQTSSRWDQFQVSQSRPLQGSWGWKPLLYNICSPISLQLLCCLPSVQIVLNCCIKGFTGRVSNVLRPGSGQCLWLGSWRNHGLHQNKLRNQGGTRAWRKMVLEQKQGEKSKDMSGDDSTEHSAASAKAAYNREAEHSALLIPVLGLFGYRSHIKLVRRWVHTLPNCSELVFSNVSSQKNSWTGSWRCGDKQLA